MITRVEIDGFKTFKDFSVELAPFQVIVGPNESGKSNLFDALHFLSRLADTDLRTAFQEVRGEAGELFTKFPDESSADRIKFAVETLVDYKVRDRLGREVELKDTRLRYELEIIKFISDNGLTELQITHEALRTIVAEQDHWVKKYGVVSLTEKARNLISTVRRPTHATRNVNELEASMALTIRLYSDGVGKSRNIVAEQAEATVLSSITNTDYPHAFAAREELRSFRFLRLNPEELRQPGSTTALPFLTFEGKNLASTLARIQREDSFAFHLVSLDMANLVPGILKVRVELDRASEKYIIIAETSDGRSFSSRLLSDGTLRLLALATLRNDPQFHGVLCLEEPENGVDPLHLRNMARLLSEMAIDLNDPEQRDEPLRQLLITTHSPSFVSLPDVIDSLLVAFTPSHIDSKNATAFRVTRMMPVATPTTLSAIKADINGDRAVAFYSIDQIRNYLDSETLEEARDHLIR
jgi:predicted ATPase